MPSRQVTGYVRGSADVAEERRLFGAPAVGPPDAKKGQARRVSEPPASSVMGAQRLRPQSPAGMKRQVSAITDDNDSTSAAQAAQLGADEGPTKRVRRARPLDLDRPMPILWPGRNDDHVVLELVSMPGMPVIEDPEAIRTVDDFIAMVQTNPDAAFIPTPGLGLTDLNVPRETKAATEVFVPHVSTLTPREYTVPSCRRPRELIRRAPGPATEGKRYDATPEDVEFLADMQSRLGEQIAVEQFELLTMELERERFCSKDKAGVYREETRMFEAHEDITGRVKGLLSTVRSFLSGDGKDHGEDVESIVDMGATGGGDDDSQRERAMSESGASTAMLSVDEGEASERRYKHVLLSALGLMLTRKGKVGTGGADVEDIGEEILAHWRKTREREGNLVRAYHSFPLLPNWNQPDTADVPAEPPPPAVLQENQQAYQRLLGIRYDLDKARMLADVVRRREKLKREYLRVSSAVGREMAYEPDIAGGMRIAFGVREAGEEWGLEDMLAPLEEPHCGAVRGMRKGRKAAHHHAPQHNKKLKVNIKQKGGRVDVVCVDKSVSRSDRATCPQPTAKHDSDECRSTDLSMNTGVKRVKTKDDMKKKGKTRVQSPMMEEGGGETKAETDQPRNRGGRGGLGRCPVRGCTGAGHRNPRFLTHESRSGCPLLVKPKLPKEDDGNDVRRKEQQNAKQRRIEQRGECRKREQASTGRKRNGAAVPGGAASKASEDETRPALGPPPPASSRSALFRTRKNAMNGTHKMMTAAQAREKGGRVSGGSDRKGASPAEGDSARHRSPSPATSVESDGSRERRSSKRVAKAVKGGVESEAGMYIEKDAKSARRRY